MLPQLVGVSQRKLKGFFFVLFPVLLVLPRNIGESLHTYTGNLLLVHLLFYYPRDLNGIRSGNTKDCGRMFMIILFFTRENYRKQAKRK